MFEFNKRPSGVVFDRSNEPKMTAREKLAALMGKLSPRRCAKCTNFDGCNKAACCIEDTTLDRFTPYAMKGKNHRG